MTAAARSKTIGAYDGSYYELLARVADSDKASHRWRMLWLDRILPVEPGDRVIDLGAGAGGVSSHLAQRGATIEAVDMSEESVDFCRQRWANLTNLRFSIADASNCRQFPDASFDKATCVDLIEHVGDPVMLGVFREAWRLLKPGGLIYVYSPNRLYWLELMKARNFIVHQHPAHTKVRAVREVVQALQQCGFEIDHLASPSSMLPVVQWMEWLWIRLPVFPQLAVYRVCIRAKKVTS